jgi:hypothetical protein
MLKSRATTRAPQAMLTNITTAGEAPEILDGKLMAQQDIKEGELVFIESCLVSDKVGELTLQQHQYRHNGRWSWSILEELLTRYPQEKVQQLLAIELRGIPEDRFEWERGDYTALNYMAKKFPYDRPTLQLLFYMIVRNNISCRGTNSEDACYGLYVFISAMQHGCHPNTSLYNHADDASCHVVATRDIKKGELLTRDFVGAHEAKRVQLYTNYGQYCRCNDCRLLCGYMFCENKAPLSCPCHTISYCSQQHQKMDWARHKKEDLCPRAQNK